MKIIGTGSALDNNSCCSSMPLIRGNLTSRIRQDLISARVEDKNSSADANDSTVRPAELSKLASELRTASSSSTSEIRRDVTVFDAVARNLL